MFPFREAGRRFWSSNFSFMIMEQHISSLGIGFGCCFPEGYHNRQGRELMSTMVGIERGTKANSWIFVHGWQRSLLIFIIPVSFSLWLCFDYRLVIFCCTKWPYFILPQNPENTGYGGNTDWYRKKPRNTMDKTQGTLAISFRAHCKIKSVVEFLHFLYIVV